MLLRKKSTYSFDGQIDLNFRFNTPNKCPRCNYSLSPAYTSLTVTKTDHFTVTYFCTNCAEVFLTDYVKNFFNDEYLMKAVYPKQFEAQLFDDSITTVSPNFIEIFNQSKSAESNGLDQISGVGYRKSLEFLVKDYAIYQCGGDSATIESIKDCALVQCIDNHIKHPRISSITKRAAWLGNDETHYVRKYTDEDIETLKSLIKLSVNWITMDLDSLELEERIVHPSQLKNESQD